MIKSTPSSVNASLMPSPDATAIIPYLAFGFSTRFTSFAYHQISIYKKTPSLKIRYMNIPSLHS